MTGISIGASLMGVKPVIVHQRVEFSLLSLEQIINQAAKWFFMNGGTKSVPLVIRLIIGRGWGPRPTTLSKFGNYICTYTWLKSY